MNYRSIADASKTVASNLWKLPQDIDLVVGIPRSGMLVAPMVALHLNIKFCDIEAFINNHRLSHGYTRNTQKTEIEYPQQAKKILVIDDSVSSGTSMTKIKERLSSFEEDFELIYAAVYACKGGKEFVDVFLELVPHPRYFEWNLLHREETSTFCYDIDGVLCLDPTEEENDDGDAYRNFILNAEQVARSSKPLGYLVTSRLEKYRAETEDWLQSRNIEYKELFMVDLPDAQTRQKLGRYASFKAEVYGSLPESRLFIESENWQAFDIANATGKHALDYKNQLLITPNSSLNRVTEIVRHDFKRKVKRRLKKMMGR
ncbi:phosphoribosyltransferase family protein [Thiomicrorhabdus sp.]|uniref:phosphoribosyltransferase family protein n=1 Tax=Thiomicrorhabdus sp. TaxID=2039724 RepID=UPI0035626EAA